MKSIKKKFKFLISEKLRFYIVSFVLKMLFINIKQIYYLNFEIKSVMHGEYIWSNYNVKRHFVEKFWWICFIQIRLKKTFSYIGLSYINIESDAVIFSNALHIVKIIHKLELVIALRTGSTRYI